MSADQLIKPLISFVGVTLLCLRLIRYFPALSLALLSYLDSRPVRDKSSYNGTILFF